MLQTKLHAINQLELLMTDALLAFLIQLNVSAVKNSPTNYMMSKPYSTHYPIHSHCGVTVKRPPSLLFARLVPDPHGHDIPTSCPCRDCASGILLVEPKFQEFLIIPELIISTKHFQLAPTPDSVSPRHSSCFPCATTASPRFFRYA